MKSSPGIFFIAIILLAGCATHGFREASVRVSPNINVASDEIGTLLPQAVSESPAVIELTVIEFSEGAETIRITDQGITEGNRHGYIKILLKIRTGNKLRESRLIEAKGHGREEILANLKKILHEQLIS